LCKYVGWHTRYEFGSVTWAALWEAVLLYRWVRVVLVRLGDDHRRQAGLQEGRHWERSCWSSSSKSSLPSVLHRSHPFFMSKNHARQCVHGHNSVSDVLNNRPQFLVTMGECAVWVVRAGLASSYVHTQLGLESCRDDFTSEHLWRADRAHLGAALRDFVENRHRVRRAGVTSFRAEDVC